MPNRQWIDPIDATRREALANCWKGPELSYFDSREIGAMCSGDGKRRLPQQHGNGAVTVAQPRQAAKNADEVAQKKTRA